MAVAGVALAGIAGTGVAQASTAAHPAGSSAPSSCRPANLKTKITPDTASSGHRHYRVTLTAAPKTSACQLAGSPSDVKFYNYNSLKGITANPYGSQGTKVTFGPGHPVHFDIQVPNASEGATANRVVFTLKTPGGGTIPGSQEADGKLSVDFGTRIGPVQPGA
ncbi:DUF4232 domain-containing protein [Streptomyces sp. ICBB 8177]|uniref:DUF4232 domain-containing protein n=1 Tax=Streptomyces sp. ICBB 8177 TaxID=563922 RepID=UPI001F54774D|nr:DUF4232 domain-containing protein [Streptomyces sp. ICBB 8177]